MFYKLFYCQKRNLQHKRRGNEKRTPQVLRKCVHMSFIFTSYVFIFFPLRFSSGGNFKNPRLYIQMIWYSGSDCEISELRYPPPPLLSHTVGENLHPPFSPQSRKSINVQLGIEIYSFQGPQKIRNSILYIYSMKSVFWNHFRIDLVYFQIISAVTQSKEICLPWWLIVYGEIIFKRCPKI